MNTATIEERQALGRLIAAQRRGQNLTQEKLAALADVPIRSIRRAERGDGIGQENLAAVALALNTDSRVLLGEARAQKAGTPDLRLKMPEVTAPTRLVDLVRKAKGVL
jgi:transcriptional regulator with XRE-family HTH domain